MGASIVDGGSACRSGRRCTAALPDGGLVPQGISAELIAEKWGITREELDAFAVRVAPARGRAATDEGRFEREIVAVEVPATTAPC